MYIHICTYIYTQNSHSLSFRLSLFPSLLIFLFFFFFPTYSTSTRFLPAFSLLSFLFSPSAGYIPPLSSLFSFYIHIYTLERSHSPLSLEFLIVRNGHLSLYNFFFFILRFHPFVSPQYKERPLLFISLFAYSHTHSPFYSSSSSSSLYSPSVYVCMYTYVYSDTNPSSNKVQHIYV